MANKFFCLFTGLFILILTNTNAQNAKFTWVTELCEYEGTYNKTLYTDTQLNNTYLLWFSSYFRITTPCTAWYPDDIEKLNFDSLDKEYKLKSTELKDLDIVKTPFWEQYRQRELKNLSEYYKLGRITMQGYRNPAILKELSGADSCLNLYADALLSGGDKLITVWQQLHQQQLEKNGSPVKLNARFNEKYNSSLKLEYARLEVINYGWWNCAVRTIDYSFEHYDFSKENFDKLFAKIKTVQCDEP